jgi:hypothetical protein
MKGDRGCFSLVQSKEKSHAFMEAEKVLRLKSLRSFKDV